MGLDNSIAVKRNDYTNSILELQQFNIDWDKEHKYNFEICYWRKCWGLRNDILYLIGHRWDEGYEFKLNIDDIDNIIALLKAYNSETWENSIWSWDEYEKYNKQYIKNLKELKNLMKKYDLEVYFYDSY